MIDEKGRVGRKINVIDLMVVLVLVLGVAFVGFRTVRGTSGGVGTALDKTAVQRKITVVLDSEPVHPGVADDIKEGTELMVFNGSTNVSLGKVLKKQVEPYPSRSFDKDGKMMIALDPVTKLVRLTVEGTGYEGKNVVTMNNQVVLLNAHFDIRSPNSAYLVAVRQLTIDALPGGAK